jgi:hypothetical protein
MRHGLELNHLGTLVIVCLMLSSNISNADTYKCTQSSGKIIYQQRPCNSITEQKTLGDSTQQKDQRGTLDIQTKQEMRIRLMMITKYQCDLAIPGFREKAANSWARWHSRYFEQVSKAESDPQIQARFAQAKERIHDQPVNAELQRICTDNLVKEIDQMAEIPSP